MAGLAFDCFRAGDMAGLLRGGLNGTLEERTRRPNVSGSTYRRPIGSSKRLAVLKNALKNGRCPGVRSDDSVPDTGVRRPRKVPAYTEHSAMPPDDPNLSADASFDADEEIDALGDHFARATLLDAIDAADLLCISPKTLSELVQRDRLRCVEFVATGFRRPIRRYRLKDLIAFIDEAVR